MARMLSTTISWAFLTFHLTHIEHHDLGSPTFRALGGTPPVPPHGGAQGKSAVMASNFAQKDPKLRQTLVRAILWAYKVFGTAPARSRAGSASTLKPATCAGTGQH